MATRRQWSLAAGPMVALAAGATAALAGLAPPAIVTAAVTGLCAAWWVLEPIPIAATSLIPFALFPLLGVLDHRAVATAYGHTLILLLLGGFMLSTAVERSGAHRRMALAMVRLVGGGRQRLVLGFMLATALSSMWISNTATTLMMLPVALAVLEQDEGERLGPALLLGIAYAASIGGLGTPIGTPPNVIFLGVYREVTGVEISFLRWMALALPIVAVLLPLAWWLLTRRLGSGRTPELPAVGAWRREERRVLMVFAVTALAWTTRTAPFGGWSTWLGIETAGDSTVALAAVVALFLVPDGRGDGQALLDWPTARKIPWGLLILFGGGIAIARAFEATGLSTAVGESLALFTRWPLILTLLAVCLLVTFLTEITSNTATTTLLMPVLAAAGVAAGVDPALLMIPAALSASCAFMLPVATAPNAIVYGTHRVTTRQMAAAGLRLNLLGAVVISLLCTLRLGATG